MLFSLYYDYQLPRGGTWKTLIGESLFPTFKYGAYALFLNGLIYHCIALPIMEGNSGFPFQYILILVNLNQFCSMICFFYPLFNCHPNLGMPIFQLFIYIPTFIFGIILNLYGWSKKVLPNLTVTGSWVLSRRRDWGLAGLFLSASQLVLIMYYLKDIFSNNQRFKSQYGDLFNVFAASVVFMAIGALGYHIFCTKISGGYCGCHKQLVITCLVHAILELLGLIMYAYVNTVKDQASILYYHFFFFSCGMVIAAFGNIYISWQPFDSDLKLLQSNYVSV